MAQSSLLGTDRAAATPKGRDVESLGPSDRSDSGSDMIGADERAAADPGMPVDVALAREDRERPLRADDASDGSGSDASGTGERRSAAGDAGSRDGADILPDRIIDPQAAEAEDVDEDEDPDLAFIDQADGNASAADDAEDEDADPVG